MTDFYSLLKQSIIERGIRDAGARDDIYAQARRAMIRQLWAFDPPLDEEEIDQRIGAFDVAVSDIEGDLAAAFANSVERGDTPADEGEPRYEAEPVGEPERMPAMHRESGRRREPSRRDRQELIGYQEPEDASGPYRAEPRDAREAPRTQADAYDDAYPSGERERAGADRWSNEERSNRRPARDERSRDESRRARARRRQPLTEQAKIRVLLGAIGACLLLLVAVGVYLLLPDRDGGVTVDIGVRREVSDAATAVRTAAQNLPVDQTFMLFDGRDPTIFETSPDNPVRFDANAGVARVSSSAGASGVRVLVGPGLAARLAGRNVRVTLVVRSSPEGGAAGMRFAYQSGLAISHWQTANLGTDYQAVAMLWRVPTLRTDRAGDFLLVEPGVPGDGTGADIKSIRIDLLAQ